MRLTHLSTYLLFLISFHVFGLEDQIYQVQKDLISSQVDSSPLSPVRLESPSLEHSLKLGQNESKSSKPSEKLSPASWESENQSLTETSQPTIGGQGNVNSQRKMNPHAAHIQILRPDAEPFVPRNHGEIKPYSHPTQQAVPFVGGFPPARRLDANWDSSVETERYQQKRIEEVSFPGGMFTGVDDGEKEVEGDFSDHEMRKHMVEALLCRVSEGFPRAQDLHRWFRNIVLQLGRQSSFETRRAIRTRFSTQIMAYEREFQTFHAMPGIKGDRMLENGFLAVYRFGRQGLNAYLEGDSQQIVHLVNMIRNYFSKFRPLGDEELEKLVFWPIMIAAAREWFYREAAKFSNYLWILRPSSTGYDSKQALWIERFREGNALKFTNLFSLRRNELEFVGKILGYKATAGEMKEWWEYIRQICKSENYHLVNMRLEKVIYDNFKKEIENKLKISRIWIPGPTAFIYSNKWKLAPQTLEFLVKAVTDSYGSREKFTMTYQLSRDCLSFFPQKLLNLVTHLSKTYGCKEGSLTNEADGEVMMATYGSIGEQQLTPGISEFPVHS